MASLQPPASSTVIEADTLDQSMLELYVNSVITGPSNVVLIADHGGMQGQQCGTDFLGPTQFFDPKTQYCPQQIRSGIP